MNLLVMVPTRSRRAQCERLLKSFEETAGENTDIVFIIDGDDQDTYDGMDWGTANHAILDPRDTVPGKLNRTADAMADLYDALMFCGNDHVFVTPGWDEILMRELGNLGSGMVYPDDKRRNDIPEIIAISSDIVKALGHFASPSQGHYYIDNIWADLGKRSGLLRYCPDAVVDHLHYSVCPETEHDELYQYAEQTWGERDLAGVPEVASRGFAIPGLDTAENVQSGCQVGFGKGGRCVLTMGNATVPSAKTVPIFTVPPGFCNVTFWNIGVNTVFIGTGTVTTSSNGMTCHSVPTSIDSYLTSTSVTFYGANTAASGASVQYVISSDQ